METSVRKALKRSKSLQRAAEEDFQLIRLILHRLTRPRHVKRFVGVEGNGLGQSPAFYTPAALVRGIVAAIPLKLEWQACDGILLHDGYKHSWLKFSEVPEFIIDIRPMGALSGPILWKPADTIWRDIYKESASSIYHRETYYNLIFKKEGEYVARAIQRVMGQVPPPPPEKPAKKKPRQ